MHKFITKTIVAFAVLICAGTAFATDGTTTATVIFTAPITIQEINPYSYTATLKRAAMPSDHQFTIGYLDAAYVSSQSQTPGCIKVTGFNNGAAATDYTITATLPNLSANGKTITVNDIMVGTSSVNCADAPTNNIYANGTPIAKSDSAGSSGLYIKWAPQTVTMSGELSAFTATGSMTLAVDYAY